MPKIKVLLDDGTEKWEDIFDVVATALNNPEKDLNINAKEFFLITTSSLNMRGGEIGITSTGDDINISSNKAVIIDEHHNE